MVLQRRGTEAYLHRFKVSASVSDVTFLGSAVATGYHSDA